MIYNIQQRIFTLVDNAVIENERMAAAFSIDTMRFSHWDFDIHNGWVSDLWLAEDSVEGAGLIDAIGRFRKALARVTPRISFIGQSYIEFVTEPYLVVRSDSNVGFFQYTRDRGATGLMFTEKEFRALKRLLEETSVPQEFYYYWNDAVNAPGYTAKLMLIFPAIEALAKIARDQKNWQKLEEILGADLKKTLFGEKGKSAGGLRHRLTHGEYLGSEDSGKNYLELIHKRVITYFNERFLQESPLSLDVVNPQRHPWGNKEGGRWFIKSKDGTPLVLKEVLADFQKNGIDRHDH